MGRTAVAGYRPVNDFRNALWQKLLVCSEGSSNTRTTMRSAWRTKVLGCVRRRSFLLIFTCVLLLLAKILVQHFYGSFYRTHLSFRYNSLYFSPSNEQLSAARNIVTELRPLKTTKRPQLVISVVTVFREYIPQQYIHYTLWSLLQGLRAEVEDGSVQIVICNGDLKPGRDAYLKNIRQRFLVLKPSSRPYSKVTEKSDWKFEKERQDYVFCINETLSQLPHVGHLLIVEDDAPIRLSGAPFLPTLQRFIDQAGLGGRRRFAFMKLYHPPRLLGYLQPEWDRHLEAVAVVSLLLVMLRTMLWFCPRLRHLYDRTAVSWKSLAVCLLLLLYTVDRFWLLELRAASKYLHLMVSAPFCCTPGILFQRQSAQEAVVFIGGVSSNSAYGKDAALYDFYLTSGLSAWYVQPNLIQHIGLTSTLHTEDIDATLL